MLDTEALKNEQPIQWTFNVNSGKSFIYLFCFAHRISESAPKRTVSNKYTSKLVRKNEVTHLKPKPLRKYGICRSTRSPKCYL